MGFTELVLLCFNFPHVNNHCKASIQDTKLLRMFLLPVIKKYIDWLKTKMTDVDPSIVWQHVLLMENNYLKAWYGQYFLSIDLLWLNHSAVWTMKKQNWNFFVSSGVCRLHGNVIYMGPRVKWVRFFSGLCGLSLSKKNYVGTYFT